MATHNKSHVGDSEKDCSFCKLTYLAIFVSANGKGNSD